jgi:hypothetical protein
MGLSVNAVVRIAVRHLYLQSVPDPTRHVLEAGLFPNARARREFVSQPLGEHDQRKDPSRLRSIKLSGPWACDAITTIGNSMTESTWLCSLRMTSSSPLARPRKESP